MQKCRTRMSLFNFAPCRFSDRFPFVIGLRAEYNFTGWNFPEPHLHDVFEVGYCHTGKGMFKIGEKLLPFKKGDISIINDREPHMAFYQNGCVWTWINFNPVQLLLPQVSSQEVLTTDRFSGSTFNNIISSSAAPSLACAISELIAECESPGSYHEDAVRGLVLSIMVRLQRHAGAETSARNNSSDGALTSTASKTIRNLAPALACIHERYHSKLGIEELAHLACMSVTNFRRAFRRALGVSPYQYITAYRIRTACTLLDSSGHTVETVAFDTGFEDPSSFRKAFKAITGMSPGEWRKRRKPG